MRQNTVADTALFCSLLVGAGIVMGIFGLLLIQNNTRKNRRQWESDMARNPANQPHAQVTFHTDAIPKGAL